MIPDFSYFPLFCLFFFHHRPIGQRNCLLGACDACWRAGPWKPCTTACGRGFQSRKVDCVHPGSCKPVTKTRCAPGKKPASWRHCLGPSCDSTYPSQVSQPPPNLVRTSPQGANLQGLFHRVILKGCGILECWGSSCFDVGVARCSLEKNQLREW